MVELGSRFFALPMDILCCRASKKDWGMWKTSGSGLPIGNKKNSFKETQVGFLVCREKWRKWNWCAVITKNSTEISLHRGKNQLWWTFVSLALSLALILIPCNYNQFLSSTKNNFSSPQFCKHHHSTDFSLWRGHEMRWEHWSWVEKVNLIHSCSLSQALAACIHALRWPELWMPETAKLGHVIQ